MGDLPKLYDNKPKKAQMKRVKGIDAKSSSKPSSSSSSLKTASPAISSYYSTGSSTSNGGSGGVGGGGGSGGLKPPEVPKESFARRYKYMWPLLLTVNLAVGAYLLVRTKKKDVPIKEEITTTTATPTPPSTSVTPSAAATVTETTVPAPQPVRVSDPIPTAQQRELFKWMLEEKRKIKTNDPEEQKRIDEEKAILKQFIRAKSIPNI